MSKLSRENSVQKMKGAGDGIKAPPPKLERTPVPSSRKFTATPIKDDRMQLKLKQVLDDLEAKQGTLKKAKTVAEITPSKTSRKKIRRTDAGSRTSTALHATPRPMEPPASPTASSSGRSDAERRRRHLELLVCRRLVAFAWRRSRTRVATLSESLRRRQEQINSLEQQVNCLKDLTKSECHKRGEAIGEYQKLEAASQTLRHQNNSLMAEKIQIQNELSEVSGRLDKTSIDLENVRNENNTKNIYMKCLENKIQKERNELKRIKQENENFNNLVKVREEEIKRLELLEVQLRQEVKELEIKLFECEKNKGQEVEKLTEQYQSKIKTCEALRHELSRIGKTKDELKTKIEYLESKLTETEYEEFCENYEGLKMLPGRKKRWWRKTREIVAVSWAVLQHAAYLMLPAM